MLFFSADEQTSDKWICLVTRLLVTVYSFACLLVTRLLFKKRTLLTTCRPREQRKFRQAKQRWCQRRCTQVCPTGRKPPPVCWRLRLPQQCARRKLKP